MDFNTTLTTLDSYPRLATTLQFASLCLLAWLIHLLTRGLLVQAFHREPGTLDGRWDTVLRTRGVIARLAHLAPALIVYYGVGFISGLPANAILVIRGVASAYVVLTMAMAMSEVMGAIGDIYERRDPSRARARPIKGYLQVVTIVTYLVAAVLVVATLFNRDPLLLLSGLGAMTAVLLLIFKDTILSLVASVQLSTHDMLRVGDWIEMPQLNANGYTIDISLHTVKVQNWDRTITTIPTWRLISESYKNWRGMFEGGGRQIQRALYLDQTSVRFLTDEETQRLRAFSLLDEYLTRKTAEIEQFNAELLAAGRDPVNARRLTNLGTFRAYVQAYIEAHPHIHKELFRLARQLQPQPNGVAIEIYCYASKTGWADYEGIQADILDHLYAILPEFGLRVFQQPSGSDVVRALAAARTS